ncbi:hypothetical protein [Corynebacterium striatum]|nr:hypothetical protein [Corynebacterium striatum]
MELRVQHLLGFIALGAQDVHLPVEVVDLPSRGAGGGFGLR